MNTEYILGEIGKRIREAREEKHWTQEELGNLVNLTRTSITNIERGKQRLPIDSLYNFADALNVDIYSLLPSQTVNLSNIELPGNKEELEKNFDSKLLDVAKKMLMEATKVNSKKGEEDI